MNDPTRCKHTSSHIQADITSTNSEISKPNQNRAMSSKPSETKDSNLSVRFGHTRCPTTSNTRDVQPYIKPDNKQAKTDYSAEESEYSDTI